MQYIILDLEWNQDPSGKTQEDTPLMFEIIDIGACKLNEQLQIIDTFEALVRPQLYPEMHAMIRDMVAIAPEELLDAADFPTVMDAFLRWCGEDFMFCTWGTMDLTELQRNMEYYRMTETFAQPLYFYDIQKLFSLYYGDGRTRCALKSAVEQLEIAQTIAFHRASADCYYTAKVMQQLDMEQMHPLVSIDYHHLPSNREEEIYLVFETYAKYVSRTFSTKEEALEDKRVTALTCYRCSRALRKKIQWFSPNSRVYYALGICPEHGFLRGKLRMKKADDGGVFAVKTVKLVDEPAAADLKLRQEALREKRREKNREKSRR